MRYCIDLTPEQAIFLGKLQEDIAQAQARFVVALNAIIAGRGIPEGANWTGLRRNGLVPDNAVYLDGALPKCEGPTPMLDFEMPEAKESQ